MKKFLRNWTPNTGVGPLVFGLSTVAEVKDLGMSELSDEYDESVGWNVYGCKDELRVYIENGYVVSVCVNDSILYQGMELIAISIDRARHIFAGYKLEFDGCYDLEDKSCSSYCVDELGLQLWESDRVIVSITCYDGHVDG